MLKALYKACMKKYIFVIVVYFLHACASAPHEISIDSLHEGIKKHYYSEGSTIVLVNNLDGTSEEVSLPGCSKPEICGDIVLVACGVDGAIDYLNNTTGEVVANCGGQCNFGFSKEYDSCLKRCPPKEWACK